MFRKNIIANVFTRIWGFVSVYLFAPLYLKFLGIEAYGLIGFYSALMGVLVFADMGFTATLNREMARLSVQKDNAGKMAEVLSTYEISYFVISILLSTLIWFSAPVIAEDWLNSSAFPLHEVTNVIQIMGIAIAFQLPAGLYIGGLMGLQLQVKANAIQIGWGVLRGVGVILVLLFISPTIYAFILWQMISNAVYCIFARHSLWRSIVCEISPIRTRFNFRVFQNTWRYSAAMAGMAFLSILLTQTDKVVVSKILPLEMLGYYTLAGALAVIPLLLASPIAKAIFPKFAGMVATNDHFSLSQLYHHTCQVTAIVIIPAGLTIILFSKELILVWTGSLIIAQNASLVTALLLGGQLLQAFTVIPYYIALAYGNMRLNLLIGSVSVVLIIPLLIFLLMNYGLIGAGVSWLVMNVLTFPPYMYFLHRKFLPGEFGRWLAWSVVYPMMVALPCVLIGYWLIPSSSSRILTLLLIILVWSVSVVVTISTIPQLRHSLFVIFMQTREN